MSTLEKRAEEIEQNIQGTYYRWLVDLTGSYVAAAKLDLAIDGVYSYIDLREKPYAGNPELKELVHQAREAHNALAHALLNTVWAMKQEEQK